MDEGGGKKVVQVRFTEQQVELIDRMSTEWGVSRDAAVERAVGELVKGRYRDEAKR